MLLVRSLQRIVKPEEAGERVVMEQVVVREQLGKAMRVEAGHRGLDIMLVEAAVELVLLVQMPL